MFVAAILDMRMLRSSGWIRLAMYSGAVPMDYFYSKLSGVVCCSLEMVSERLIGGGKYENSKIRLTSSYIVLVTHPSKT